MRVFSQNLSLSDFLTIGPYEEDKEFRELLQSIAQKGLFIYGLLGVLIIVFFVSSHLIIVGKTVSWSYVDLDSRTEMLLLDKILIFLTCSAMMLLSKISISLKSTRILVFMMVWLICIVIPIEDIAGWDTSFTIVYNTIALLFAVGTVPFRGWHTALLSGIVIIFTFLALSVFPILMELPVPDVRLGQIIFISVVAFLLTGMSSQIYLNRYEQYRAKKKAEELSKKLEERNLVLQMLKDKSEKQAEKILENEKLKDRFFANISHEFRTPLTLILGPLQDLLGDHAETDKKEVKTELLRLMQKNGHRLLDHINQLLDLSKIDARQIKLNVQEVDLSEFIPETVLSFSPLAESQRVTLTCSIEDSPVPAVIDPPQIERVIGNLVSNAIKFTPGGGSVTVSLMQQNSVDNSIRISVRDTGVGIPKDELTHIFDRFYQAPQSREKFNKGTGIGLALVKEIVELHKGNIRVDSEPGKGSEFSVILKKEPYASGEYIEPDGSTKPMNRVSVSDGNDDFESIEDEPNETADEDAPVVLLIDDNRDILDYLEPHVSKRYKVIAKESSSEALKLIKEQAIDLVISDVMMPHPDGFELCRLLKGSSEWNHIPVILLTAQAAEESRVEGLEIGADDYISKPFSASELMVRVENLIELRRTLREKFSQQVRIKGKKVEVSSDDARFLKQVQSAIDKHMENSNFGVDWLADEVNLSSRQLQRKIRSIANLSAGGYIRMMRLERASQLLAQEWGNVSEIAYRVGFQDAKYFSRLFKQTFGVTPTEYVSGQE